MAKYLISYDYHKVRNYKPLYQLLGDWGAARILESLWLVEVNATAASVRAALKSVADHDDAFVVIQLWEGSNWAVTKGVYLDGVEWLQRNIAA